MALDTSIGLKDSMSAAEPLFRDVLERFHSSCYPSSSLEGLGSYYVIK